MADALNDSRSKASVLKQGYQQLSGQINRSMDVLDIRIKRVE
jgi:hypothetical protein